MRLHSFPAAVLVALGSAFAHLPAAAAGAHAHEEARAHEAHVHGLATMNIVTDAGLIEIDFSSPAANIVGFEHAPTTDAEREALAAALDTLRRGDALFRIPDTECELEDVAVETDLEAEHDETESPHSEFSASYHFRCTTTGQLQLIETRMFEAFPGIEEIEAQLLTPTSASFHELTAQEPAVLL